MTINISGVGKITANKDVLNLLSILAFEASENYENGEFKALAEQAKDISDGIFDELKKSGYFDS